MAMELFTMLDAEWDELAASGAAADALRTWASEDGALAGFEDLRAVLAYVQRRRRPLESDRVLAVLARRAGHDVLAARMLLQAMIPGLINIATAFRTATFSDEEVASVVVAAAYERIRTYPFDRRPRCVAANVLLDTRQAVSRSLCRPRVPEVLFGDVGGLAIEPPEVSATDELLTLIDEAVRLRQLRVEDARLIVLTRVADVPVAEIAAREGCPPQSVRRRRLRAEAVLAAAVA